MGRTAPPPSAMGPPELNPRCRDVHYGDNASIYGPPLTSTRLGVAGPAGVFGRLGAGEHVEAPASARHPMFEEWYYIDNEAGQAIPPTQRPIPASTRWRYGLWWTGILAWSKWSPARWTRGCRAVDWLAAVGVPGAGALSPALQGARPRSKAMTKMEL